MSKFTVQACSKCGLLTDRGPAPHRMACPVCCTMFGVMEPLLYEPQPDASDVPAMAEDLTGIPVSVKPPPDDKDPQAKPQAKKRK